MPGGAVLTAEDAPNAATPSGAPETVDEDRRRFTRASLVGIAVAAVPFLWTLWWDGRVLDPFHTAWPTETFSNLYDLQVRAWFDGHWWVPKGALGIEGFIHDGREYTYFGPFAAILRVPVMMFTDALDGQLTAPSMLLAWCVLAIVVPLFLWRIRLLIRGPGVAVSRAEAVSCGVVVATILGGSVFLWLGSMPWAYHEDFIWSAALSLAALFALTGMIESPSRGRVVATGLLTLAAVLNRYTTGWGCVIAVGLVALWFGLGRYGDANRRWWKPTALAAVGPLAAGALVTFIKFGMPFGLPMADQVWARVNEHRRNFLAANGGRAFSLEFIPSTAHAYLNPAGVRLSPAFPFIGLPSEPAPWVGDVILDQTYRTASVPATMPLLMGLAIWGLIVVFRPRAVGRAAVLRFVLLGAIAATSGVMVWGYIAHRYLADFMPVLMIGAMVGLVDVWRRFDGKSRTARRVAVAVIAALGMFSMYTNFAIASEPTDRIAWRGERIRDFLRIQDGIGSVTGHTPSDDVQYGATFNKRLPDGAPAGQLFLVGYCDGLYYSIGERENGWIAVDRSKAGGRHELSIRMVEPLDRGRIPIVTVRDTDPDKRPSVVWIEGDGTGRVRFGVADRKIPTIGEWIDLEPGTTYPIQVDVDTALHEVSIDLPTVPDDYGHFGWLSSSGEQEVHTGRDGDLTVTTRPVPPPKLCYDITGLDPAEAPNA